MKSSKIENMFNFNPTLEETKGLSPLTYYHPFQSSFDPEFATPITTGQESPEIPKKKACQGVERQSDGHGVIGRGHKNPWRNDTIIASGFECNRHGQASGYYFPETRHSTSWSPQPDSAGGSGMSLSPSWPSLLAVNPDRNMNPTFPNHSKDHGSKFLMSGETSLGMFSRFSPNSNQGTEFGTSSRPASSFANFDSSPFSLASTTGQSGQVLTNFEGTDHRPVFYPLMFGSFARNLSHNLCKTGHNRPMVCNFCKNNKEVPDIYLNHYLYDPNTKILSCPVLRKHVCEICGGTGDQAHTLQYCPVNRERGLQAKVPVLLKTRTITNSTGKIRRN